jgi:hypothetical protein
MRPLNALFRNLRPPRRATSTVRHELWFNEAKVLSSLGAGCGSVTPWLNSIRTCVLVQHPPLCSTPSRTLVHTHPPTHPLAHPPTSSRMHARTHAHTDTHAHTHTLTHTHAGLGMILNELLSQSAPFDDAVAASDVFECVVARDTRPALARGPGRRCALSGAAVESLVPVERSVPSAEHRDHACKGGPRDRVRMGRTRAWMHTLSLAPTFAPPSLPHPSRQTTSRTSSRHAGHASPQTARMPAALASVSCMVTRFSLAKGTDTHLRLRPSSSYSVKHHTHSLSQCQCWAIWPWISRPAKKRATKTLSGPRSRPSQAPPELLLLTRQPHPPRRQGKCGEWSVCVCVCVCVCVYVCV